MKNDEVILKIDNLSYSYKDKTQKAISNINLEIQKGSFTTFLGPSGCGKTTLLRCISGFLEAQEGSVYINGINQNKTPPHKRKIGMVFQDYALFPHLTTKQNILYGLKINKTYVDENNQKSKYTKEMMEEKLLSVAQTLSLEKVLEQYPYELSGGQQQRVALARAIILNPQILLMDEPLSSLDTKLRQKVRDELKDIQQKLGITTIYVTHDQEEALSLSDNIAVINEGKILQTGSPRDLYFKPSSLLVSDLVGFSNVLKINDEVFVVRPQWFEIYGQKNNEKPCVDSLIYGKVEQALFLGDKTRFKILIDETKCDYKLINENEVYIVADLPTLESNFLDKGCAVVLKINHKWKL